MNSIHPSCALAPRYGEITVVFDVNRRILSSIERQLNRESVTPMLIRAGRVEVR